MLSYQHIYHAGGQADVHKHSILLKLLNILIQKERPLSYMETHAGRGWYDLSSFEARKTNEYNEGIENYLSSAELRNTEYGQLIAELRKRYNNSFYPGSPMIAKEVLRAKDELFLMELHPGEINYLRQLNNFNKKNHSNPQIHIHHRDGYDGVLALSPPKNRRGLILIDPSYEIKSEYSHLVEFVKKLHRKWAEAVIVIWYPILKYNYHKEMLEGLKELNLPETKEDEVTFNMRTIGSQGSGIFIINKPWGF